MSKQETIKNSARAMLVVFALLPRSPLPNQAVAAASVAAAPEAYEACADLAAGDSCAMTGRRAIP